MIFSYIRMYIIYIYVQWDFQKNPKDSRLEGAGGEQIIQKLETKKTLCSATNIYRKDN